MALENGRIYNSPVGQVSPRLVISFVLITTRRKLLSTSRKNSYFMPMADVTAMPKHFGKTIKNVSLPADAR